MSLLLPAAPAPAWAYNRWLRRWQRSAAALPAGPGAPWPDTVEESVLAPFEASDRVLVERAVGGDTGAYETLHRRYYARIYRFAFMKLGNAEDAADVASAAFCRAFRALPSFRFSRGSSALFPWLHRIAGNLVTDHIRQRQRHPTLSLDAQAAEEMESFLDLLPADGPGPDALVLRQEIQESVRHALAKLPQDQARAIELRYFGDLSMKEMSAVLDRSEGAVKSLLHRALGNMRKELGEAACRAGGEARLRAASPHLKEAGEKNDEVVQVHQRDS